MIQAKQVSKSFELEGHPPRRIEVLKELDLEVAEGEFVALLGPSGSGKSTLLAILAGLDRPSSGSIQIAGQRIDALDEEEMTRFRGKNLGFVFQSYHLIPTLTALENAMLPLELQGQSLSPARDLAAQELQRLGLSDRLDHLPRQLSGGEQQRVAIARALVSRPRVIFADEPTGNLDSSNALMILDYLLALRGRTTVMLVTHDANLAARADRVLRLKDGALA